MKKLMHESEEQDFYMDQKPNFPRNNGAGIALKNENSSSDKFDSGALSDDGYYTQAKGMEMNEDDLFAGKNEEFEEIFGNDEFPAEADKEAED